jgi:hypothetical protein
MIQRKMKIKYFGLMMVSMMKRIFPKTMIPKPVKPKLPLMMMMKALILVCEGKLLEMILKVMMMMMTILILMSLVTAKLKKYSSHFSSSNPSFSSFLSSNMPHAILHVFPIRLILGTQESCTSNTNTVNNSDVSINIISSI